MGSAGDSPRTPTARDGLPAISTLGLLALACGLTLAAAGASWGQALPLAKHDRCPPGYVASGSYCQPGSGARPAIERVEDSCPLGYLRAGAYCIASGSSPRSVLPRRGGDCPIGTLRAGDYCVAADGGR